VADHEEPSENHIYNGVDGGAFRTPSKVPVEAERALRGTYDYDFGVAYSTGRINIMACR